MDEPQAKNLYLKDIKHLPLLSLQQKMAYSNNAGGNVSWCSHDEKQYGDSSKSHDGKQHGDSSKSSIMAAYDLAYGNHRATI